VADSRIVGDVSRAKARPVARLRMHRERAQCSVSSVPGSAQGPQGVPRTGARPACGGIFVQKITWFYKVPLERSLKKQFFVRWAVNLVVPAHKFGATGMSIAKS